MLSVKNRSSQNMLKQLLELFVMIKNAWKRLLLNVGGLIVTGRKTRSFWKGKRNFLRGDGALARARKSHIVGRIIRSNQDSFKELIGKLDQEDYKKIYNRCYKRLRDRCLTKEQIKGCISDEIESELFKLLEYNNKIESDAQKQENEEFSKSTKEYPFPKMHGVDLWGGSGDRKKDALAELENGYNKTVENGFKEAFCPYCMSNPCLCRYRNE